MEEKLTISSELIDDYKRMSMVVPEKKMHVDTGEKALYSIGNDGNLYLLYENTDDHKGWERVNLTKDFCTKYGLSDYEVTTFDVRRNDTQKVIVLAVRCGKKQQIFYGKSEKSVNVKWESLAAPKELEGAEVSAIYLSVFDKYHNVICDWKENDRITRYFIDVEDSVWRKHELPADFEETTRSVLGRTASGKVDGIYTLGKLHGDTQLLYTPLYNRFNKEIPPLPIRFQTETAIEAMAMLVDEEHKYSHLFVCGALGLYVYPAFEQKDLCSPRLLMHSEQFNNVSSLCTYRTDKEIVVTVVGAGGSLIVCRAAADEWLTPEAWRKETIIKNGILGAESIWDNNMQKEIIIGVSKDGKEYEMLECSDQTRLWEKRSILIPDLDQPARKIPSYVTRVSSSEQQVSVSASRTCCVYINEQYYRLDTHPQVINCDEMGTLRIVEEATGMYATEIIVEADGIRKSICPSKDAMQRLFELDSIEKLKNAKVNGEPLIGKECDSEQLEAIAQALDMIGKHESTKSLLEGQNVNRTLHSVKRGNLKNVKLQEEVQATDFVQFCFSQGNLKGISKQNNSRLLALPGNAVCALEKDMMPDDMWDVIYTSAAEFFQVISDIGEKILDVTLSCVKNIWNFTVRIGKTIYTFIMDTLEKIAAGLMKLLEYIKVGIKKIIDYLKYLFDWNDIKKVANALEGAVSSGFDLFEQEITQCQEETHKLAEMITTLLDKWADIEHHDVMKRSLEERGNSKVSLDVKQSYLIDYSKDNLKFSIIDINFMENISTSEVSEIQKHIENIFNFVQTEKVILDDMIAKIKKELLDENKLKSMSFGEICKKLLAIIGDVSIYTLENIIISVFEVVKILIRQIKELLVKPIHIPVVSDILKDAFGIEEKSILEVGCLVISTAAVPLIKICGGEEMLQDEVLAYIKNPRESTILCKEAATGLPISTEKKKAYAVLHIVCGVANLCETWTGYKIHTQVPKVYPEDALDIGGSILGIADVILSVIDGSCYMVAFFIYQPCALDFSNTIKKINIICSIIKYSGLFFKIFNKLADENSEKQNCIIVLLKNPAIKYVGIGLHNFGAGSLLIVNVFYMVLGTDGKSKEEKELLYLDCSSLISDNLRIILDNTIPYITMPQAKTVCIGMRIFFSIVYSALQIAEGADALAMD